MSKSKEIKRTLDRISKEVSETYAPGDGFAEMAKKYAKKYGNGVLTSDDLKKNLKGISQELLETYEPGDGFVQMAEKYSGKYKKGSKEPTEDKKSEWSGIEAPESTTEETESDPIGSAVDEALNAGGSTTEEVSESQKYYDLQEEYLNKYLSRGNFDYDVNADELYKMFRDQTLDAAEKARRHAQAQAAGLTGGYGSTYAAAAGNAAYEGVADDIAAAIPDFYASARDKYDREGTDLLTKADIAGAYADTLEAGSYDIDELMSLFGSEDGTDDEESDDELFEAKQSAKTTAYVYRNPDENEAFEKYEGKTNLWKLANAMYADGVSIETIEDQLTRTRTQNGILTKRGEVDYVISQLEILDKAKYVSSLKDKNGVPLTSFYEELVKRESVGTVTAEQVIAALVSWRDENGKPLDEEYLLYLVQNL